MKALRRVGVMLRRHKHAEEAAAEAVGLNVVWTVLRGLGLFGAGIASAAVVVHTGQSTYHPGFSLSTKGAAFITRNEGVRYAPYNDPFNCTVGVGHLIHYGVCSSADYARWKITAGQATTLLLHDSSSAAACIHNAVTHPINQSQFDALVDLAFNAGCGSLDYRGIRSTINAGRLSEVPGLLAVTAVTANGVYLSGLRSRRLAEGSLFAHGYYGAGIGYYLPPKPLTAAQKRAAAKAAAVRKLRARTGYWSWLAWRLGAGPWRAYKPAISAVRPHVPERIPALWFRRERAFVKARKKGA